MNNKEAIKREKLYYEGLEKAIAQPIPAASAKELDEIICGLEDEEQAILRLWKEVLAPLDVAIAFIHDNRVLPQGKDQIVNDDTQPPFMLTDEIFGTLSTLISPTVGEFLSVLPISSVDKKKLLDMVEKGDQKGFVSILEKTRCDTTPLAKLCACCMDDVMAGLTMTDEERAFSIDHIVGTMYDDADNERVREVAAQLQTHIEQLDEDDTPESTHQFYEDFFDYIVNQLAADLHYYWEYYELFTLKERNFIEPIFNHPLAVDLVNQLWDEYKASLVFSLPDDFFHSKCAADDTEHLYLKPLIESSGAETFTEFINYVAEKGYIENNPSVKSLFAYRLTGYCRPEGDLFPIAWNGKNGKSYELIYILRYLCDGTSYKKMRLFFEGPEWVKEKDSSYAHSADTEFRRRMVEFYPEVCEFKK